MNINADYERFYKGAYSINARGADSTKKDTVVRYQFNTTDDEGNHVMDKMSKEESYRVMNEISSQYGDNVIVEFSGDGLTALAEHNGKMYLPEDHKEIPEDMITDLGNPQPLSSAELAKMNQSFGDNDEALMRRIDPEAYKEYQSVRKAGLEAGTPEGIGAGMKYIVNWVIQKGRNNADQMNKERETQRVIDDLSRRFWDADITIGNGESFDLASDKSYSIILSDEELNILKGGSEEEKEKLYRIIEESMKKLSDMKEAHKDNSSLIGLDFGLFIGKDNIVSFLAKSEDQSYSADSIEALLDMINKKG